MFTNEQLRNEELKIPKSRVNYFRSYNQKPHRQTYLKEYGQVRRLVAKYNPFYRDKRKRDRHKLDRKNRYQLAVLIRELSKRGWSEANFNPSQVQSPYLFFKVALVDKKSLQTSYSYRSLVFLYVCENPTHRQKQEAYQFAYLVQKESEKLRELLVKKPLLFRKKLEEIEKTVQAVGQHWKKTDIIQTVNQIPQEKGWQLSNYWEKQDLSALLLRNGEAGGKNKLVLDFDHYKKDGEGRFLMGEEQRKEIDLVIDYLINYWKLPWYEVSKSGARKLHLEIDELPWKSKLWWKGLVVGDILGRWSQTTLPISKGRKVEFSKWSWMGIGLPEIRLESWEGDLGRFSLGSCDERARIRKGFVEGERKENNFLSTNTTTKKELGYYGTKVVKPLKIFYPQLVKQLNSIGGSRDSVYYQVDYLDAVSQQVGSFLVDASWREKEFSKIIGEANFPFGLVLRIGERVDFLMGIG